MIYGGRNSSVSSCSLARPKTDVKIPASRLVEGRGRTVSQDFLHAVGVKDADNVMSLRKGRRGGRGGESGGFVPFATSEPTLSEVRRYEEGGVAVTRRARSTASVDCQFYD